MMTIKKKMSEGKVELVSKSQDKYEIDREIITKQSVLLQNILEDEDEDETPTVPLLSVDSTPLQKVIEYCKYHHNNKAEEIEKPLKGKIEDVICQWDKQFLDIEQALLIELVMAANYMNIKDLLDLTCAKVASLIKGKSPEQIRDLFGIDNDFTAEEEAKLKEENKWCEES